VQLSELAIRMNVVKLFIVCIHLCRTL